MLVQGVPVADLLQQAKGTVAPETLSPWSNLGSGGASKQSLTWQWEAVAQKPGPAATCGSNWLGTSCRDHGGTGELAEEPRAGGQTLLFGGLSGSFLVWALFGSQSAWGWGERQGQGRHMQRGTSRVAATPFSAQGNGTQLGAPPGTDMAVYIALGPLLPRQCSPHSLPAVVQELGQARSHSQ